MKLRRAFYPLYKRVGMRMPGARTGAAAAATSARRAAGGGSAGRTAARSAIQDHFISRGKRPTRIAGALLAGGIGTAMRSNRPGQAPGAYNPIATPEGSGRYA